MRETKLLYWLTDNLVKVTCLLSCNQFGELSIFFVLELIRVFANREIRSE